MRMIRLSLLAALAVSAPVGAGTLGSCSGVVENNEASAALKQDPATARVLDRLQNDSYFSIKTAAAELVGVHTAVPDEVIGHLRWAIRSGTGSKLKLYYLLNELKADGRADVADQYLEGLADGDPKVRTASADGLGAAPSGKRQVASSALLDLLSSESDPSVYHMALTSLARVAGPEIKARVEDLTAVLKEDPPAGTPIQLFIAWKAHAAAAMIAVLGPEEAVLRFRGLDLNNPTELAVSAGALQALTIYAGEQLGTMDPERRNRLGDVLRQYGIDLLAKATTSEEAAQHSSVREAVPSLFWMTLGRKLRPEDATAISTALEAALRVEPPGTVAERNFSDLLRILEGEVRPKTR